MGRLPAIQILSLFWFFSSSPDRHSEMRPALQGGKTAGIKTTPFIYSENIQNKLLCPALVWACGCPSHQGISASLHYLLPRGSKFLLNQMDRSLTDPAFVTRRFVRVSLLCLQDCHSNLLQISTSWSSLWRLSLKKYSSVRSLVILEGFTCKPN